MLALAALIATTAIVGAQSKDNSNKHHIFRYELGVITTLTPEAEEGEVLPVGWVQVRVSDIFREGGAGDPIGKRTSASIKIVVAPSRGAYSNSAHVFDGLGTIFTTRITPNDDGRVQWITSGTGAFEGASGRCDFTANQISPGVFTFPFTCDLGIKAPQIP